ncbi:MAG TPA: protein kinase, partial [Planctomycetota bacterium]|nr:protein kinase [Planctomycetota bacterium]
MCDREDELSSTKPFVPQDESAAARASGKGVPDAYPDLDVKGEIGHGGMGTVFLAREKSASRDVALKVLAAGRDPDDQRGRTRFLEEAQVTAQLQHPGIVPVYRIGEGARGRPYYTMRPIEGRTLRAVLDDLRKDDPAARDRFGLRRLVQVFQFVCQAVRFAHDRGVIHRDLKPSNVVVGDYGEVLVIDWGLAKAVSSKTDGSADAEAAKQPSDADVWKLYERRVVSLREDDVVTLQATVAGAVMGTPAYMPPEQIRGDVGELDARSDIWSLGVVLYELCTLRLPFEGKDLAELTTQITKTDPPDPITANPQRRVPPELRDVILRCLKRDRTERYASLAELLTDIEHWLEGVAPWRLVKDVDFSEMPDGEPEGWTCIRGRWRVARGVLASEDERDNVLLLDEDVPGDVRVEVEARVIEGSEGEITLALCVPPQTVSGRWQEGYSMQFGAHSNSTATLQKKSIAVAGVRARYTPGRWHAVVVEKTGNLLRLRVDGGETLRWLDPEPLSGPWVGLYGCGSGLRVRRYRVLSRGLPVTVSCLAVPDAFYEKGMVQDAKVAYLEISENHGVRDEGLHALFRAGKCDLRLAASP